jgi:bacillithiol biosynthesis cysteine-adding enzyme BshC
VSDTGRGLEVIDEALGGTPLSRLAQSGAAPVAWYPERPASVESWRRHIERVRASVDGAWWEQIALACQPQGAAAERMDRVVRGGGVIVTSGQQPGLFGGPLYTWFKAVSALALADTIEGTTGIPAAPVFWAATDDSDYAEGSWTAVALPGGAVRLALPPRDADGTRLNDVAVGDVSMLLETLYRACGTVPDRRPMDAVRGAYGAGATLGGAYVTLLRTLLEPIGITVLDAAHPAAGQASYPLLLRALHERDRIRDALTARAGDLRAAGFEPQVSDVEGRTLVFELVGSRRERIGTERAAAAASQRPGQLSPNVLLRPIVERWLMPSVCYLAGPGELAYFAQVSAVATALELDAPLALPRWSATIIEPHIGALLDEYGLTSRDFADPHAVETRWARSAWPEGVNREFLRLREALAERAAALRTQLTDEALLPPPVLDGVERGIAWRLARFERRFTAAVKRRHGRAMHDLSTIRGALYPEGLRQERALNAVPFLAREGLGLLDQLRESAGAHARSLVRAEATPAVAP